MRDRDWTYAVAPYAGIIFFASMLASCLFIRCEIQRIGYVTTDTHAPETLHD